MSLIYGYHPLREALRHRPHSVCRVLVSESRRGRRAHEIEALCNRLGIAAERVPAARLDELTAGAVHNGFAAEVEALETETGRGDPGLVVLLEDIADPRNLGAVLRVCDGAAVGRVLIRDRGSAPVSAAAVKASAGAAEHLAVERVTNPAREIGELKKRGFWVYGADAEGEPVWDVDLSGKLCLVLGGEEKGLRARTRDLCDGLVSLPMLGRVDSLNVAAAAAALLYEAVRQRKAAR